jgi:hypothetical protein
MNQPTPGTPSRGSMIAILLGVLGGFLLLSFAASDLDFGPSRLDRSGRLSIHINGVSQRMARDIFLPTRGWVLQLRFLDLPVSKSPGGLVVILRSERTGATIEIQDRFVIHDEYATLVIPKQLGLAAGLLSVRAVFTDESGKQFEDARRIRIRSPLGSLPIGLRQVIHFDFGVDHDGDGRPDFWSDLERFGLASENHPELAQTVADKVEARALARVEAAYDPDHDPNLTGLERDPVTILFRPSSDPAALTTRICVGGSDPTESRMVGHVRFDLRNEDKTSVECSSDPAAGLFPRELETYSDSALYRDVFDPFLVARGGKPVGEHPDDEFEALNTLLRGDGGVSSGSQRQTRILRAITILGDVLGSIMAHEAGHALGLVAIGRPSVGLFGGSEGSDYAHNIDVLGESATSPWLMNAGESLGFAELAGEAAGGGGLLRFRPLNHAYLRDRVIVTDKP